MLLTRFRSPALRQRAALILGALALGIVAVLFARAADMAQSAFAGLVAAIRSRRCCSLRSCLPG